jgi:N-acetylmuramoyl-L-alanine amidase
LTTDRAGNPAPPGSSNALVCRGIISGGIPLANTAGSYSPSCTAEGGGDGVGSFTQTGTLTVTQGQRPDVVAQSAFDVVPGELTVVRFGATDPDDQSIVDWSATDTCGGGSFDWIGREASFAFTPDPQAFGTSCFVEATAFDPAGYSGTATAEIAVRNNSKPTWIEPQLPFPPPKVREGETLEVTVIVEDLDGDTITFPIDGFGNLPADETGVEGATLLPVSSNGQRHEWLFSWKPTPEDVGFDFQVNLSATGQFGENIGTFFVVEVYPRLRVVIDPGHGLFDTCDAACLQQCNDRNGVCGVLVAQRERTPASDDSDWNEANCEDTNTCNTHGVLEDELTLDIASRVVSKLDEYDSIDVFNLRATTQEKLLTWKGCRDKRQFKGCRADRIERVQRTRNLGADLFVSIHTNAGAKETRDGRPLDPQSFHGTASFSDTNASRNHLDKELALGKMISDNIAAAAGGLLDNKNCLAANRNNVNGNCAPWEDNLFSVNMDVIQQTKRPALLIEVAYHSNYSSTGAPNGRGFLRNEPLLAVPGIRQVWADAIALAIYEWDLAYR